MVELSEKEYRALPAESFSSIKYILEDPQTFLFYKNKPFKGNNNTLLGTAIHNYLQGNRHLVAVNVHNRVTKAGKEAYAKFEAEFLELAGEEGIIVPKSFEETLSNIMANYSTNARAIELVEGCQFEIPYFVEIDGVRLKGRVDGVNHSYMLEIKSSGRATNIKEFREEAKERNYDMQAALYLKAHEQTYGVRLKHYFIVANTQAPFAVNQYPSGDDFINEGEEKLKEAVRRYKKYIINGEEYVKPEEHL